MAVRSFSRTAEELGLTQPTVSGHIKTLEEEIGLRLFDRYGRKVLPTSAAFVLLDFAQKMLELRTEAQYALDQFKGKMAVACGSAEAPFRAATSCPADRPFRPHLPGCPPQPGPGRHQGHRQPDHGRGHRDRMVGARIAFDDLKYEALVQDEMVLVMSPDHHWAGKQEPVTARELIGEPFIMREEGSGTRTAMLSALGDRNVTAQELNIVAEMGSTEAVLQAVKAGLGVSVVSRLALAEATRLGMVKSLRIGDVDLGRRFYLVTHEKRTRSPLCRAFLDFLRENAATAVDAGPEQA